MTTLLYKIKLYLDFLTHPSIVQAIKEKKDELSGIQDLDNSQVAQFWACKDYLSTIKQLKSIQEVSTNDH